MQTGELYARIQQMREAATTLNQSATRIQDGIEAVESEMRALTADRFMSISAESFRAEYQRVTPRLKEAFELIGGFRDKLNQSADDIELAARSGGSTTYTTCNVVIVGMRRASSASAHTQINFEHEGRKIR